MNLCELQLIHESVTMKSNLEKIRSKFPALDQTDSGMSRVFLDNPAGTQVPVHVLERIQKYLIKTNANQGGYFIINGREKVL